MKKIYSKLITITIALILSVTVVVMSSYAWLVLSESPAMEGMQITIGGGTTILVAADMSKEVDGQTYHYPGHFSSTINFTQYDSYDYLDELAGLMPVSTADGVNWFIPDYYDIIDIEVKEGRALAGVMKPQKEFIVDDMMDYANLGADDDKLSQGHYIYLDFWVVSPGEEYSLRVSTGEEEGNAGSFAIDLMEAVSNGGSVTLASDGADVSSSIRIGFLLNPDTVDAKNYEVYEKGNTHSDIYSQLRGNYTEPGSGSKVYSSEYTFTIYEPNGNHHPSDSELDGTYIATKPMALTESGVENIDIRDRLTVQKKSEWTEAITGNGTQIEQRFQTAIVEQNFGSNTLEAITSNFYQTYLGGQVAPYVTTGKFIKNTENLYSAAQLDADSGLMQTGAEYMDGEHLAGATDDVSIGKLEKNVPQRIRMFIWIEGEDVDCVNSVGDSSLAINIELAGSNIEE